MGVLGVLLLVALGSVVGLVVSVGGVALITVVVVLLFMGGGDGEVGVESVPTDTGK